MQPGANILVFGEALKARMREAKGQLPVGIDVSLVSNQPAIVEESIHGFVKALVEAVVIVLGVSFVSLGWRAGLVVAVAIPLSLAITFVVMQGMDITLRRISLGALIIALGLFVDDAMITVEMTVARLAPEIDRFRAALPAGYRLAVGGEVEESGKGQGPILQVVPLTLIAMTFVLMVQLRSLQKLVIVMSVAPLGLIGVVAAMLVSGKPLGFVAVLGVLPLIGIIVRNAVILIAQIEAYEREGQDPWHAVIEATCHRMRPILLTAAAACLAMIPIAREVFWGPMAYAMIGGIVAATLLTLFFLPALYVGWYRIAETRDEAEARGGARSVPS